MLFPARWTIIYRLEVEVDRNKHRNPKTQKPRNPKTQKPSCNQLLPSGCRPSNDPFSEIWKKKGNPKTQKPSCNRQEGDGCSSLPGKFRFAEWPQNPVATISFPTVAAPLGHTCPPMKGHYLSPPTGAATVRKEIVAAPHLPSSGSRIGPHPEYRGQEQSLLR